AGWSRRAAPRQREAIFRQVLSTTGNTPLVRIDKRSILAGRERRAETPSQARHFLDTMRGLFAWAIENSHVTTDPAVGVKAPKRTGEGFPVWTESEIERFEKKWPIGTRERLMFDLFRYTGLRRGDAAQLGKQHIREGAIVLDTQKTGTRVTIPILPELQRTL